MSKVSPWNRSPRPVLKHVNTKYPRTYHIWCYTAPWIEAASLCKYNNNINIKLSLCRTWRSVGWSFSSTHSLSRQQKDLSGECHALNTSLLGKGSSIGNEEETERSHCQKKSSLWNLNESIVILKSRENVCFMDPYTILIVAIYMRFSQRYFWRLRSSGIWICVVGQVILTFWRI